MRPLPHGDDEPALAEATSRDGREGSSENDRIQTRAAFDAVHFEGKPLASYKSFIYGPVCIDRGHRGCGLLRGLYEALKRTVAGQFEVGVAFVARNNLYSLQAHVAGLDMVEVGEFEVKDNVYVILAFNVR